MYANFGIFGIIFGAILLGYIYELTYRILIDSKYNSFMIIIYQIVIYKFALSSKNIVQSAIMMVLVLLIYKFFNRVTMKKEIFNVQKSFS